MSYRKKFHIKGLKSRRSFQDSLEPVVGTRLRDVELTTRRFLAEQNADNLHCLRIACRRFRYTLEIYSNIIKPRRFRSIYDEITRIQDVTGRGRDLDVMKLNIEKFQSGFNIKPADGILQAIENERRSCSVEIVSRLQEFMHNRWLTKLCEAK